MTMRVQLLVSEWCVPCRGAEEVWRAVAQKKSFAFEVLDVAQPEGRAIVARIGVRTVPSTVIDGELKHLGVPSMGEATALVAAAPDRVAAAAAVALRRPEPRGEQRLGDRVVGHLSRARRRRIAVRGRHCRVTRPWRAAALHAYGMGFVAFVVLGLGEHLLPRFTGAPIRGGRMAWTQFGLVHAGTLLMVAGFLVGSSAVAIAGGLAAWAALALFAYRLVPVLRHSAAPGRPE